MELPLHMDPDKLQKYLNNIEDNVNVGKSSDLKEFFIVIFYILVLLLAVFYVSDFIADYYISIMPAKTQLKVEKFFENSNHGDPWGKYERQINKIEKIKKRLITHDKNLQNKSDFPIYLKYSDDINAYVTPSGAIFFTSALLNEVNDEQELAFILAHEMGHYANRDHLRYFSRQILIGVILGAMSTGQSSQFGKFTMSVYDFNNMKYSQKQERLADSYANNVVMSIYHTNKGALNFFKRLDKKQHLPGFVHYFSSHPAPSARIKLLKEVK